jgi:hypothetical protein
MAYKVFSNGNALNASELNTYLMNQSVMVFASTTARDAALTAPTEGMLVWLEDSNKFVYYTGSAWSDLIAAAVGGWSDKSANYSVVAGDLGKTIRSTGSAITVTIDNVLTAQGDRIDFIQAGSGQVTFAAGSGVTLSSADGNLKTAKQYAAASVIFGGSGVYYLVGNLGA